MKEIIHITNDAYLKMKMKSKVSLKLIQFILKENFVHKSMNLMVALERQSPKAGVSSSGALE